MPRSHQTLCAVLAVKLLGIMLSRRWWPTIFVHYYSRRCRRMVSELPNVIGPLVLSSLRNNRLKFKASEKLPIIGDESIEYCSYINNKEKWKTGTCKWVVGFGKTRVLTNYALKCFSTRTLCSLIKKQPRSPKQSVLCYQSTSRSIIAIEECMFSIWHSHSQRKNHMTIPLFIERDSHYFGGQSSIQDL